MPFINLVGTSLFGDDYVTLDPQSNPGFQDPLEVLEQPKPPQGRVSKKAQTLRVAERIHGLLYDPSQFVRDRYTEEERPLVAGDIAINCPTNKPMQSYADSLRQFGIKAKIAEDGWIESRVIQITWHALEYVENPGDKHAALYLACTELGSHELETGITTLVDEQKLKISSENCDQSICHLILSQLMLFLARLYKR